MSGILQRAVDFVKYEGLGNDFIMINNLDSLDLKLSATDAVHLCDQHLGVGADGVIFVLRDEEDFQMQICNSDGSEPELQSLEGCWLYDSGALQGWSGLWSFFCSVSFSE
jgi:diaminopimelate epimerase